MENTFNDFAAFFQVIVIDLALSADNAVAVGLAAAALPDDKRRKAVAWGVGLALGLRIVFGLATVFLMNIHGLLLIGGIVLLYIAYRMWSDVQKHEQAEADEASGHAGAHGKDVTFAHALFSIVLANIALSLDNVLAVAGVSRHSPAIMAFGLILSVALMGLAASLIAKVIDDHPWIAIVGIVVIILAGLVMMWEDLHYFFPATLPPLPAWLGGERQEASLAFALG